MLGPLLAWLAVGLSSLRGGAPPQLGGPPLPQVGWEQRLGARIPLEARFRREDGTETALRGLIRERPVVLALVYYRCPMLCNFVLNGLVRGLRGTSLDAGKDFDVLVVSIDPAETPELARAKRDTYVAEYGRGTAGWSFLVGDERDIRLLADSVGFTYTHVPETGEYAHAAGLSILTPAGELSRVLFGSEFAPRDLKLALVEAGGGKIGSPIDELILRCFHYDPAKGRYGFAILSVLRGAGVATVVVLAALVMRMLLRERRRPAADRPVASSPAMFEDASLFPRAASTAAGRIDGLYFFLLGMAGLASAGIFSALILFSIRYRRGRGHAAEQMEGSNALEILWSSVPLVLWMGVFGWGAKLYLELGTRPADAMEFFVTGKQWMWKIQHPTGQREINQLHVPVGRAVVLRMISEDVIHSFYVPAFRLKQDVRPGSYSSLWFEANRVGTYHLFCAEYCGTKHSEMIGSVIAMEPADYERWLAGQPADEDPIEAGRVLFANLRCDTCHAAGSSQRGPDLAGRFGAPAALANGESAPFDADYVRQSILEPAAKVSAGFQPVMPTYRGQVSEGQIHSLIAYIQSLATKAQEEP